MSKKIFILVGHPDKETSSGMLATSYEEGARAAGHEVRRMNIGDLSFDPILHKGYKVIQELEPDLKAVQENLRWADHFVLVYPNWWGAMPALLKGMFDRMILPGFGFKFKAGTMRWDKLLCGKSARVIVTMDQSPWMARILFGDTGNEIRRATLEFCGIDPVRMTRIGPMRLFDDKKKATWKDKIALLGKKAV